MRIAKASARQLLLLRGVDFRHLHFESVRDIVQELIDRRLEDESELRKLERSLAYENAVLIIEGACAGVTIEGAAGVWFDGDDQDEYAGDDVEQACRYLDLRGLLQRDAANSNLISIRDESEATA